VALRADQGARDRVLARLGWPRRAVSRLRRRRSSKPATRSSSSITKDTATARAKRPRSCTSGRASRPSSRRSKARAWW
jgi:hypothetical protein